MEIKTEIPARIVEAVLRSSNLKQVDELDRQRADLFGHALKASAAETNTADLGQALRMVMLSDQGLMDEVAFNFEHKGESNKSYESAGSYLRAVYNTLKDNGNFRAPIDSDSGAGDNDFGGLFVEKVIKKRVESESDILQVTDNKRLTEKNNKFPKSSNGAFAAKSDDLTDLTATIDGGFDNTALESQKFGGTMFMEADFKVKLDAQTVTQIMDELVLAYSRGMRDQMYNGAGTGVLATGMFTNATAIAFDGNVTNTLIKMIASIADVTKGGSKDIFILTNTAGRMTLEGEKFINKAYDDLVEILGGVNFLKRFRVIEDNVLVTSGSSPDKTAPLLVGKNSDYLVGTQTDPQILLDEFSDFKAGGSTARIMGFWTAKPHFNDSFSKTTIPAIY